MRTAKPQLKLRTRRCGFDASGLSLLDVTLTMLIIAIISMIALPAMGPLFNDDKLRGATAEVVAAMEYAKGLAAMYQRPFYFETDAVGEICQVRDTRADPPHAADPQTNNDGVVLNPLDKRWYKLDFWNWERYRYVDIDDSITMKIYPGGHHSDTDTVLVLSYEGASKTITVNGFTGRISVN